MNRVSPVCADRSGLPADRTASTPASQSHARYRPDIDGLRGVAVLSVLAVHSFPHWIKSGFIGVDICFVLSGFLITGVLLQSLEAGRFSYVDFYARRVRRIVPALCLVFFACLAFNSYFNVELGAESLLDLRSLGVQAQFYLVWPFAAAFLFRHRRWALWIMGAAVLGSFVLNDSFVVAAPTATALGLPARFWQLMVGALLAYLTRHHRRDPLTWLGTRLPPGSWLRRHLADAVAAFGILLLIAALALADRAGRFPGWWALLSTFGTVALLAAGAEAWVNQHVLSHAILRFYGAISYPLYLWHGLLLSVPAATGTPLTNEVRVMILIGSVALAALTYDLLEKPIRFGSPGRHPS